MWWEFIALLIAGVVIANYLFGCVGVDPSARMGNATVDPTLTAETIENAVQTAINSNASIVNDVWPIVAMCFIVVAGLVAVVVLNKRQTKDIKEHTENCIHS